MGTSSEQLPGYLTTVEVARMLGMSLLYIYTHARELGGIKIGRDWKFPENRLPGARDSVWVEPKLGRPKKRDDE